MRGLEIESTTASAEEKGEDAIGSTAPFVAIGGLLAALVLVWAAVVEVDHRRAVARGAASGRLFATLDPAAPATVLAAIAGALLVFWFTGRALRAVDATRARIGGEARRLLQWLPRDRGRIVFPAEGIADPSGCVDAGMRVAVGHSLEASLSVVAAAVAIGAVFRWTHALGAEAVIALAWIVALLSAPLGLALAAAAAAWGGARRLLERVRVEDVSEDEWARVTKSAKSLDDFGAVLGGGLATATSSIAKLVAAAVLAFLPLFL
jgi:K(+)-stimulated pyrophosphate-energized sodium pump